MKFLAFLLFCFFATVMPAEATPSADWQNDKIQWHILSEYEQNLQGRGFQVLVTAKMLNGWHISADNPGDAGTPTVFEWDLPRDWQVRRLNFSAPQLFMYDDVAGQYGYGRNAYFWFEIFPQDSDNLEDKSVKLTIKWGACKDYCEEEEAFFKINLPPQGKQTIRTSAWADTLKKAEKTFPLPTNWSARAFPDGDNLRLEITAPEFDFDLSTTPFYFMPGKRDILSAAAAQDKQLIDNRLVITTELWGDLSQLTDGTLIYGDKAYTLPVEFTAAKDSTNQPGKSWFYWLLTAFTGGILLNFMPCVFPILSLKVLSLAQNRTNGHQSRIKQALLYGAGVLCCFSLMAAALSVFQHQSQASGWGFQLQSSWFVLMMLIIFIIIALFMLDIIKPSGKLAACCHRLAGLNSFLTGFFAVLIASPCTGPFMGAAIGYALLKPSDIGFAVFLSLGAGYSLPFMAAEIFPGFIGKILPKPGKWTVRLKHILALPVLLTCVWLGWVLYHQSAYFDDDTQWEKFDFEKIQQLKQEGKPFFIDFTAKWCITCLVNEKTSLQRQAFLEEARQKQVILIKADWTSRSSEIGQALQSYGRRGVPLYVYNPGNGQADIILPQLLSPQILSSALNRQNQQDN